MPRKLRCLACGEDIVGWGTPCVHPKGWHYVFCQECDEANEVTGGTDLRTVTYTHLYPAPEDDQAAMAQLQARLLG